MFKKEGFEVIDADKLAHKLYSPGSAVSGIIKESFGKGVFRPDGRIDRLKLGKIVFSSKRALGRLNRIVHPELIREINRRIENSKKKFIVLDAALIIEAGLREAVDALVVVTAKKNQQVSRGKNISRLGRDKVKRIMEFQISQNAKSRLADFIIDNSGSIGNTKKQVLALRKIFVQRSKQGFF